MKRYFNYAFLGAIALLGATMFTGCSGSDDAVAENNPNYDATTGLVKSQFVLNIASNAKPTRSGGTTVQAGGENFRGIDNTLLFAYKTGKTSGNRFVDATLAGGAAANRYDLGRVAAADFLDNNGSNSHRILELAMPTGTDAMLFYGKAIKSNSDKDEEVGKVTYSVSGSTATDFHFDLNTRVGENTTKFEHTAQILAAIMTKIINVSGSYTVVKADYPSWTGNDGDVLTSTWKEMNPGAKPGGQGRTLSPLEEILYKAFTTLTSYGDHELRGGSAMAILTTVKDLYSVTIKVANATPTSPYEELAKHLAQNINTQINSYFTSSGTEAVTGFNGVDVIKTAMGTSWNTDWNDVVTTELSNFPVTTFTLPEGAAQLEYTSSTNTFSHKHPGVSLLDKSTSTNPDAYTFPAELMYYCNSGVRTSNTEKTDAKFPNGVTNWDTEDQWTTNGWESGSNVVTSATRATAMTKNVNYGVAMLKSTVQIKEGITALEDNRKALNPGEENKTIASSNINFTWTGVIVGGQPVRVDWQFLPLSASTFDKLVYDNQVAGDAAGTAVPKTAGSASAPNYTILFDNYNSGAAQNKVRVALQFVNNGDDFWGRDNLIRKGQTFYLVAELDPTGKEIPAANWDTHYQVPPLDGEGNSTKTTRIFVQDYMTTVNFKLTADATNHTSSLQDAYVTIPDLRSSQLSFGLSVDLDWRAGLTFDADLGGN
ncbi:hypothetical protein PRLR6014_15940 [Prevotella lacticifex]|uniref:hypothetical protein n=1 Tax=Prevotella lacticifex TaxID=2854755 RepID=UPI001CC43E49|nr:hypothetical protein [Prevotella lacticifex]GJG65118.1 hypothetical protein PRLR6014_15940 [Prevotella lacticifex]